MGAGTAFIYIAAYSADRCQRGQLVENRAGPDIAGVENQIDVLKKCGNLRIKILVGVGDYAISSGLDFLSLSV